MYSWAGQLYSNRACSNCGLVLRISMRFLQTKAAGEDPPREGITLGRYRILLDSIGGTLYRQQQAETPHPSLVTKKHLLQPGL